MRTPVEIFVDMLGYAKSLPEGALILIEPRLTAAELVFALETLRITLPEAPAAFPSPPPAPIGQESVEGHDGAAADIAVVPGKDPWPKVREILAADHDDDALPPEVLP